MKNFSKLLFVSSFCLTALSFAQNYPQQYSNNPNYPSQQGYYPAQPQFSQGQVQYRDDGYMNRGNEYGNQPGAGYQVQVSRTNDQSTKSNWFGTDKDNAQNVPDDVITATVTQNLRSTPYFSDAARNLQVMTKDGKVTLKGKVANKNERYQIEYMVKNVEGVKSVSNDLQTEK